MSPLAETALDSGPYTMHSKTIQTTSQSNLNPRQWTLPHAFLAHLSDPARLRPEEELVLLQDQSLRGHESPKPMGKTPRHTIGPGVWNQELDG